MIETLTQLNASLFQLASFVDALEALHKDCEIKDDFRLYSTVSEGYISRIRELNSEIRQYLQHHPEPAIA